MGGASSDVAPFGHFARVFWASGEVSSFGTTWLSSISVSEEATGDAFFLDLLGSDELAAAAASFFLSSVYPFLI